MNFYVLTIFPDMIEGGLKHSIIKRACDNDVISITSIDIRDFSADKHNRVDDYPYGGGAGMVMKPEPIYAACLKAKALAGEGTRIAYMTPQGRVFDQKKAEELSQLSDLILLCGHYEGIDERVISSMVTDEISIGDFVLTGGELPAMMVIDAVSRLIPGVLNKQESYMDESFSSGLLEYPQYTRPYDFNGMTVPDILLSGHHQKIADWRLDQARKRTQQKRPDLLQKRD